MKKRLIISILITLIIEIFIFNFGTIKSSFYEEIKYDISNLKFENVSYDEKTKIYYCSDAIATIELEVNEEINNIYMDLENINKNTMEISLDYTDDANNEYDKYKDVNEEYYSQIIVKNIKKSKYIDVNHLGKTHNIKIYINSNDNPDFVINEISFNKPIPFSFSFIRILIILIIVIIISLFKNNTSLTEFINKHEKKLFWLIVILFSILLSILYFNYSKINANIFDYYSTSYKEALMNGKLEFDIKDIDLNGIKNIYDYTQRDGKIPWDVSYYNGNYYMYFSFLPALIMGITNSSVSNLSLVFSIIATIFLSLLTKKIIEKYFPKVDVGLKLLMIIFVLFNSRLLLLISRVRFYELIIICSFCFAIIGIYFYLLYDEKEKNRYMLFGSIFLSLAIVCRPNMIFVFILGLFIIYKKLTKKNIIPYFMPYILFGVILMYINYIRFGNIFEFGIKYQLSVVNMNYLKFDFSTILNGIYTYLLRIPNFITQFPYITNNVSMIDYYGFYFNTSTGNGIIPMSVIGLALPFVYKKTDKKILKYIACSILIGMIILISDNCFGGALKRYSLEFSWLFIIPIVLLAINSLHKHKKVLSALVIISCLMNFFIIFDNKTDDLGKLPENDFYYTIQYLIEPN